METATQILHWLTSYEPGRAWDAPVDDPRVVQDLQAKDPARRPWFFKRYTQLLPRLSLPRDLPATTAPAIAVLAGAADLPRTALDLAQLPRLLHLSAGVVRPTEQLYGTHPFRAAGSAGGRFPLELYIAGGPALFTQGALLRYRGRWGKSWLERHGRPWITSAVSTCRSGTRQPGPSPGRRPGARLAAVGCSP